jgi:His/Glu/Gln/Arg/opine family amino acid ABC transporter permease subunit
MDALWNTLVVIFPSLVNATILTIAISVIAGILAILIAIPAGLGRLSRVSIIRAVSAFYVETIRGTPLLFQLLVWGLGVQIVLVSLFGFSADQFIYKLLTDINSNSLFPVGGISGLFFGIIGLGVNYSAYMAEVVRAGVQSVEHGQTEAALSLGLSRAQATRFVILPQAFRIMIPPLTNNFITLVQDTTFLGPAVAVYQIELVIQTSVQATSIPTVRWGLYIVELALFFVMCYSLALISRRAERRSQLTIAGAH